MVGGCKFLYPPFPPVDLVLRTKREIVSSRMETTADPCWHTSPYYMYMHEQQQYTYNSLNDKYWKTPTSMLKDSGFAIYVWEVFFLWHGVCKSIIFNQFILQVNFRKCKHQQRPKNIIPPTLQCTHEPREKMTIFASNLHAQFCLSLLWQW